MLDLESVRFFDLLGEMKLHARHFLLTTVEGKATVDPESDRIIFHCKSSAKVPSPGHD